MSTAALVYWHGFPQYGHVTFWFFVYAAAVAVLLLLLGRGRGVFKTHLHTTSAALTCVRRTITFLAPLGGVPFAAAPAIMVVVSSFFVQYFPSPFLYFFCSIPPSPPPYPPPPLSSLSPAGSRPAYRGPKKSGEFFPSSSSSQERYVYRGGR